jgi:protein phosphatase
MNDSPPTPNPCSALPLDMWGISDTGRRRDNNEDAILLLDRIGLAMVADGMGGHNAGEIASQLAIDAVRQFLLAGLHIDERDGQDVNDSAESLRELMEKAIWQANQKIRESAGRHKRRKGMGTTFVGIVFRGNWFVIGHVGDSRCYRLRDGQMQQLTEDHSWVQDMISRGVLSVDEARKSPQRGLLLQALGNREIEPSFTTGCPLAGDVYLLCSDGLTEPVSDEEIADAIAAGGEARDIAARLVDLANANGGPDNISAAVVRVLPESA